MGYTCRGRDGRQHQQHNQQAVMGPTHEQTPFEHNLCDWRIAIVARSGRQAELLGAIQDSRDKT
jgi:hypothetical protein